VSEVCLECYNIGFKISENNSVICPKCGNKNLVNIDDLLIPSIILFNRKGYGTLFSCQGHLRNKNLYIWFKGKIPPKLPKEFVADKKDSIIRYHFEEENEWNFFTKQLTVAFKLQQWSNKIDKI